MGTRFGETGHSVRKNDLAVERPNAPVALGSRPVQPIGTGARRLSAEINARQPLGAERTRRTPQSAGLQAATALTPLAVKGVASAGNAGVPLPAERRTAMEPVLGHRLRDVRIHTDSAAAKTAEALGAEAFTIGRDIYFGAGKYDPNSRQGRALLAHELMHTVEGTPLALSAKGGPRGGAEAPAEAVERAVAASQSTAVPLGVADFRFRLANEASPGLSGRSYAIFQLARQLAPAAVDRLVARDPALASLLNATRLNVPEIVTPVRIEVDGKSDYQLAEEIAATCAQQVVQQVRRIAALSPASPGMPLGSRTASVTLPAPAGQGAIGQRAPVMPAPPARPTISEGMEALMKADVQRIVEYLKQQWMSAREERSVLGIVEMWARLDDRYRQATGYRGSDYLDRFLFFLKMRVFTRRTARSAWVKQWGSAYDTLFYELEGERLTRFKQIVAKSEKQGTTGPESQRMESAWSYVGKRQALGVWGILKGMGLTLAGVADTAIWVHWRTQGVPLRAALAQAGVKIEDQPPSLARYLDRKYDEVARELAGAMASTSKEQEELLNEEVLGGASSYGIGTFGGKVVGTLTTAGAMAQIGRAGQVIGAAQTAQAAEGLYDTVRNLRKGPPPLTWGQIAQRPDVWVQVVGVVGGAIGAGAGFAPAKSAAENVLRSMGQATNAVQIALLVAAYQAVDEDPTLATAEEKRRVKEELLLQMLTTGLLTVDMRYGPAFKDAWARKYQQGTGRPAPGTEVAVARRAEAPVDAPAVPVRPKATGERQKVTADEARIGQVAKALSEQPRKPAAPVREEAPSGGRPREAEAVGAPGRAQGLDRATLVRSLREIRQAGNWKGKLEASAQGRHDVLAQARQHLVNKAIQHVCKKYADLEAMNVGSAGFGSDIDVTFQPRAGRERGLSDPTAMRKAIAESGAAAREFTDLLRKWTGGEPSLTLDANAYTYTGVEGRLPAQLPQRQRARVAHVEDVASLAEMRISIEKAHRGNARTAKAAWEAFRRQSVESVMQGKGAVGEAQAKLQEQMRSQIERQFVDAEKMFASVRAAELAARRSLRESGKAPRGREAMKAQAREQAAAAKRDELLAALNQRPVDHVRVRQLQSEIKLLEPGAYATGAAIRDVVLYQQTLRGEKASADVDWRVARGERGETTITRVSKTTGESFEPGAGYVDPRKSPKLALGEVPTDPRVAARSAASSLAQLTEHVSPNVTSRANAHSQLKAVAKYCNRIDANRTAVGMRSDVPEITATFAKDRLVGESNGTSQQLARERMLAQWAERKGLAFRDELVSSSKAFDAEKFQRLTERYVAERLDWAQRETLNLRVLGLSQVE